VGQAEDEKEDYGIYVALTGARFEKKKRKWNPSIC